MQANIVPAIESVSTDTIRKYYRRVREYIKAYREGITDGVKVKLTSHTFKQTYYYYLVTVMIGLWGVVSI